MGCFLRTAKELQHAFVWPLQFITQTWESTCQEWGFLKLIVSSSSRMLLDLTGMCMTKCTVTTSWTLLIVLFYESDCLPNIASPPGQCPHIDFPVKTAFQLSARGTCRPLEGSSPTLGSLMCVVFCRLQAVTATGFRVCGSQVCLAYTFFHLFSEASQDWRASNFSVMSVP